MYYKEFMESLKEMPVTARAIRWRRRGEHIYKSAIIIPLKNSDGRTWYNLFTGHDDKVDNLDDIFVIGCWPVDDCVKIMNVLYSYNDEIIGEV